MPKNKGKASLFRCPAPRPHLTCRNSHPAFSLSVQCLCRLLTSTLLQGGKNRRRGKNENDNEKRELTFKEEGQEYAQVLKMLGNGRLEALCFDGEKRLAHIRVSHTFPHTLQTLGVSMGHH
jgi:hypothetical protein